MKKLFFVGLLGTAMATNFVSCSNEDDLGVNDIDLKPLAINVGINSLNQQSRAGITSLAFSGSEKVGLFLYKGATTPTQAIDAADRDYNSALAVSANIVTPINIPYERQGDGSWLSTTPIILSNVEGVVYSYYPHDAAMNSNDGKTIAIKVNTTQGTGQSNGTADVAEQTDYMWGTPVGEVSNSTEDITLQMNHALAMLTFKFERDTYPGEGVVSAIEVKNAPAKELVLTGNATMNISTGAIDNSLSVATGSIKVTPAAETLADVTDAAKLPRMLVYPMPAGTFANGDAQFVITLDGKNFTLNVPADNSDAYKWAAGNNYVYTFTLVGHELVVKDVKITKWNDVPYDGGEMTTPDA